MKFILNPSKIKQFHDGMEMWRAENRLRDFPWRRTKKPFEILVTEILLRRTKADSVSKIWVQFFQKYKKFQDFENNVQELRKDLIHLGLIEHRTKTLLSINSQLNNSDIPLSKDKLIELYGVGQYISGVTVIMLKNQKEVIYDTNFKRVYARYFKDQLSKFPLNRKHMQQISDEVIPQNNPREFILTLLDFAAITCKVPSPNCQNCPLKNSCDFIS